MLQITTAQLAKANTDLYRHTWPKIDDLQADTLGQTSASFAEALAIYNASGPYEQLSYWQQLDQEQGKIKINLNGQRTGKPFFAWNTGVPELLISANQGVGFLILTMRQGTETILSQHNARLHVRQGKWACEREACEPLRLSKRPLNGLPLLLKDALEPRS